jgi:hypothetical protein
MSRTAEQQQIATPSAYEESYPENVEKEGVAKTLEVEVERREYPSHAKQDRREAERS